MRAHQLISRAVAVSALALPCLSAQQGPVSDDLRELIRKEVRDAVRDALRDAHTLTPRGESAKAEDEDEGAAEKGKRHIAWVTPDGHGHGVARVEIRDDDGEHGDDADHEGHAARVFEWKGDKGMHVFGQGKPIVLRAKSADGENFDVQVDGTTDGPNVRTFTFPGGQGKVMFRKVDGDHAGEADGHGRNFVFRLGDGEKGHVFSISGAPAFSFGTSASSDDESEECSEDCCGTGDDEKEHGSQTKVIEVRAEPTEKSKETVKKSRRIHV